MNWRIIIPPDLQQQVWALPAEDRDAFMALVQQLRQDPDAATGPYGEEDTGPVRVRSAAAGTVIAVLTVNDITGNVSFMAITHVG